MFKKIQGFFKTSPSPTEDHRLRETRKLIDEVVQEMRDSINGYPPRSSKSASPKSS